MARTLPLAGSTLVPETGQGEVAADADAFLVMAADAELGPGRKPWRGGRARTVWPQVPDHGSGPLPRRHDRPGYRQRRHHPRAQRRAGPPAPYPRELSSAETMLGWMTGSASGAAVSSPASRRGGSMTSPPGLASSARRSVHSHDTRDLGAVEIVLGTFGYRGRLHRTGLVRGRGGGQRFAGFRQGRIRFGIDICGLRGLAYCHRSRR